MTGCLRDTKISHFLVGGWTNPFETYESKMGSSSPSFGVNMNKYLKPPTRFSCWIMENSYFYGFSTQKISHFLYPAITMLSANLAPTPHFTCALDCRNCQPWKMVYQRPIMNPSKLVCVGSTWMVVVVVVAVVVLVVLVLVLVLVLVVVVVNGKS